MDAEGLEDVWRRATPHVLAALLRRYDGFADCEDAVQLALVAASEQWPRDGVPDNPVGWLVRVAQRRLVDQVRADASRRAREDAVARLDGVLDTARQRTAPALGAAEDDDALGLLVLCADPALTPATQVALMLRAVAGLTTREIAAGFFVPEPTMAQRISRAKATLTANGARLVPPSREELPHRLLAVRHAVALLYTSAHAPPVGRHATDPLLARTALRLARELHRLAPVDPENAGLLALLLLTHARAATRVDAGGDLVPLDEQDRSRWDHGLVAEGTALLERTLPVGPVGTFQLQAAIAAVHAEASDAASTDWPQVLELYRMLARVDPSPASALGLAVATAEVEGAQAGLDALADLPDRLHRTHAARGHLLARLGRHDDARAAFLRAAELTRSIPEQRHLNRLAERETTLGASSHGHGAPAP